MTKQKAYFILGRTLWVLVIAGVVVLLQSAMKSKQQSLCSGLLVNITAVNGRVFIDENDVKQILTGIAGGNIERRQLKLFPLRKMEDRLRKEVWIKDAQLYFDNEGLLHANVTERIPIARVFDVHGNSFYLDSAGLALPLSTTDRSDVPVFTNVPVANKNNAGLVSQSTKDILAIALALGADSFWNAQAAQVDVVGARRFELYPAIGFHVVELGTAENIQDKLLRLKIFYQKVLAKGAFTAYTRLSVAYKNQVVGIKGDGQAVGVDAAKAMEVFDQLVNSNKKELNALAVEDEKTGGAVAETNKAPNIKSDKSPPENKAVLPAAQSPPPSHTIPKAVLPPKTNN